MIRRFCRLVGALCLGFVVAEPVQAAEVNLYSARKEVLIKPLLERFTAQTGIEVNLLSAGAGALLARLQNEGRNTPADLLLTVDAGNLHRAREAGVLQPLPKADWLAAVPEAFRDPQRYWVGLSLRARVIFRAKDRVPAGAVTRYEDLADARWRERICIRSSDNIYNQSLVASLIAHHGEAPTEAWARALVANMARSPQGGDTDQLNAVAAGVCDLAVANTYYYGRMLADEAQRATAEALAVVWPNQDDRGAHVNVSGIGVVKHAEHAAAARQLIAFLLQPEAQRWYAEVNHEFPVREDVAPEALLQSWGTFAMDRLNLQRLGALNGRAVRLMDRAGWR